MSQAVMKPVACRGLRLHLRRSCPCGSDHVADAHAPAERMAARISADANGQPARGQRSDYGAESIKVLEGLEGRPQAPGHVHRLHRAGRACTTSSTRSSTTRSTRRWPATATRSTSRIHIDNSVTVVDNGRGIPVDMHAERQAGRRGRADEAARRRQVRQQQLQGLRRPARRRRLGGQRAVRAARARDLARRPGLPAELRARQADERPRGHRRRRSAAGTKITFKPDAQIFETTDFSFDTLAQRLRELAFLNAGLAITLDDERATAKSHRFHYEGGIVSFVEHLNKGKERRPREADLHARRAATASTPRSRCSGTTATTRRNLSLRQQHQHARGRHAPDRASGRR